MPNAQALKFISPICTETRHGPQDPLAPVVLDGCAAALAEFAELVGRRADPAGALQRVRTGLARWTVAGSGGDRHPPERPSENARAGQDRAGGGAGGARAGRLAGRLPGALPRGTAQQLAARFAVLAPAFTGVLWVVVAAEPQAGAKAGHGRTHADRPESGQGACDAGHRCDIS